MQPPRYEAKVALAVNLDVIKYQLTSAEEYRVMETVYTIVNSREVKENVVAEARSALGYSLSIEELQRKAWLERRHWTLEMRIRDQDPGRAAALVDLWAEMAYQKLQQAQEHAILAYQIQQELDGWLACLPGHMTPTPGPLTQQTRFVPGWNEGCTQHTPEEIESITVRLSKTWLAQSKESLGLAPFLTFTPPEKASLPESPVLYDRGTLILAGATVGFLVAIWMVSLREARA